MSHFVFVLFSSNASSFCPPFLPSLPPSFPPSRWSLGLLGFDLHAACPRLHHPSNTRGLLAGKHPSFHPSSLLPSLAQHTLQAGVAFSQVSIPPSFPPSFPLPIVVFLCCSLTSPSLPPSLPPPSLLQVTVPRPQSRPTLYPWVGFVFGWLCLAVACGYVIVILGPGEKAMRVAAGRFRRGGGGRGSMGGSVGGKMEREALVRQRQR